MSNRCKNESWCKKCHKIGLIRSTSFTLDWLRSIILGPVDLSCSNFHSSICHTNWSAFVVQLHGEIDVIWNESAIWNIYYELFICWRVLKQREYGESGTPQALALITIESPLRLFTKCIELWSRLTPFLEQVMECLGLVEQKAWLVDSAFCVVKPSQVLQSATLPILFFSMILILWMSFALKINVPRSYRGKYSY